MTARLRVSGCAKLGSVFVEVILKGILESDCESHFQAFELLAYMAK